MIRLSVLYPTTDGATFDHDYYRDKHVPLAVKTWGLEGAQIDKGVNGPYVAAVHFEFPSLDAMGTAMAVEGTSAIMADVANYTTITPVMQTSEIVTEPTRELMFSLSSRRVGASIAVSDVARAREFYEGVLGLVVRDDSGGGNVAYTCADDTTINIFFSPNAGTAKSTLVGFDVGDIYTAVDELAAQGVTFEVYTEGPIITDERGIASFEGGNKVAYFKDPDGNILSLAFVRDDWREPLDGARVATRLPCQDLDRARSWYREKLGLEPTEEREGGLRYTFGPTEFALFSSTGAASGESTQMAINVPDIDAAVAGLKQRGVEFEEVDVPGLETKDGIADIDGNYPSKGKGERGAWFRDSEGNLIGLGQAVH